MADVLLYGRYVWDVRLEASVGEDAHLQRRAADVLKDATRHFRTAHGRYIVETGGCKMTECAALKVYGICEPHRHGSLRACYPCLVFKLRFLGQTGNGKLICVKKEEAALQRHMSFVRRAQPRRVLERHILKSDVAYQSLSCPLHGEQSLGYRHHGAACIHVGIVLRIIVDTPRGIVLIPFARLVEQFKGVGE